MKKPLTKEELMEQMRFVNKTCLSIRRHNAKCKKNSKLVPVFAYFELDQIIDQKLVKKFGLVKFQKRLMAMK